MLFTIIIMGLINKGWYGMFFACGIWCVHVADVLSVSPSLKQIAYNKLLTNAEKSFFQNLSLPVLLNITRYHQCYY